MKETITNITHIALIALIAVFSFKVYNLQNTPVRPADDFRVGNAGAESYQRSSFYAGLVQGGQLTISTTSSTYTLKDGELAQNSVISFQALVGTTPAQPAITVTLPASTTWPSLDKVGVVQRWVIDDLHTSAATTTTIVAGTGVDIDGPTANDDIVNGGVSSELSCWRLPNTDIRCIVKEMVDAG